MFEAMASSANYPLKSQQKLLLTNSEYFSSTNRQLGSNSGTVNIGSLACKGEPLAVFSLVVLKGPRASS